MMDKKISVAQLAAGDMLALMSDEIDAFKKNKNILDNSYTLDVLNHNSSDTPALISDTFLGMPPGYFVGQTPPPSLVQTGLVRPVTGQTTYYTGQHQFICVAIRASFSASCCFNEGIC